jgi:hypothetical protein
MSLSVTPVPIQAAEFSTLTQTWQQHIDAGDMDMLRACFTSSTGALSNYAFLPGDLVSQLLDNPATVSVRTKFLLAGDTPTFSMAVYGISKEEIPTTPYFLMGVATEPATIENDMPPPMVGEPITPNDAASWVMNWHALTPQTLTLAPFNSPDGPLLGYTFPVKDFQDAWAPASGADAALWLIYDMHNSDKKSTELLFSTIVILNTVPSDAPGVIVLAPNKLYYDVSKPCPPYC